MASRLVSWFRAEARTLPFRTTPLDAPRDPYVVLVSEIMLQQTQVDRVADRFPAFVARFPTFEALAKATTHEVLAQWSGLGYYRRARLLHEAAQRIVAEGRMPATREQWRALPGIGDYTSGALAAFVSGEAAPAVDGNVTRVIGRLDGVPKAITRPEAETRAKAWMDAACVAGGLDRAAVATPAMLNEALIELGATVCTPRNPRCSACPIQRFCAARRDGLLDATPSLQSATKPKPRLYCATVLVRDCQGRYLLEPRPMSSIWPGLWQPPTLERDSKDWSEADVKAILPVGIMLEKIRFIHQLTHREVRFSAWESPCLDARQSRVMVRSREGSRWFTYRQALNLPLSSPHRRILRSSAESQPWETS